MGGKKEGREGDKGREGRKEEGVPGPNIILGIYSVLRKLLPPYTKAMGNSCRLLPFWPLEPDSCDLWGSVLGADPLVHTSPFAQYTLLSDLANFQLRSPSEVATRCCVFYSSHQMQWKEGGGETEQGFRFKVCSVLE